MNGWQKKYDLNNLHIELFLQKYKASRIHKTVFKLL